MIWDGQDVGEFEGRYSPEDLPHTRHGLPAAACSQEERGQGMQRQTAGAGGNSGLHVHGNVCVCWVMRNFFLLNSLSVGLVSVVSGCGLMGHRQLPGRPCIQLQ